MYFIFSRYVIFICTIELAHFDFDETQYEPPTPVDIIPEETLGYTPKGGTPTDIKRYPFVVSIQKFSIPRCVGSLISDSWVLTAAHCLIDLNRKTIFLLDPFDFIIISGRTIMTSGTMEGQERLAGIFIIHSRFDRVSFKYDVGMVETTKPFVLGPSTQTIKMYSMPPEVVTLFQSCTLVGWNTGKQGFDDYEVPDLKPNSMKLEKIEVNVMSALHCQAILYGLVSMESVCTYLDGQCPGQSGSPLICGESLFGVLTWTAGCTNSSFPAVYARLSKIYIWVNDIMRGRFIESFRKVRSNANEFKSLITLLYFATFITFQYYFSFCNFVPIIR